MRGALMRIEVAASEVLGGPAVAWVEPNQVIGLVARGEPGSFLRTALLPRFQRLEDRRPDGAEPSQGDMPPIVSTIASIMSEVHDLLWRENQIGHAAWADALACVVAGDKFYFLCAGDGAAYSVKRGRVYPLNPAASASSGLGRGQKARVEISSMDITAGERVILVAAGARPDDLAIAHLFSDRLDLQRACDGLLPLTAGPDGGAGAVALSFVPLAQIAQEEPREAFPSGFVEELTSALAGVEDPSGTLPVREPTAPAGSFTAPPAASGWPPPDDPAPAARPVGRTKWASGDHIEPTEDIVPFLAPIGAVSEEPAAVRAPQQSPPSSDPPARPPRPPRRSLADMRPPRPMPLAAGITAGLAVLMVVLVALAGPGSSGVGGRLRQILDVMRGAGRGTAAMPETYLMVLSDPPGATASVDGQPTGGVTPTQAVAVSPGTHRVVVQFGELGRWERVVEVRKGSGVRVGAVLSGSVAVGLMDTTRIVQVTLDGENVGRAPLVVPDVPVGEHRLAAFGIGLDGWERGFAVAVDETTRVTIGNGEDGELALLSVTSAILGGGGYQPSRGENVYVDRELVGVAPVEHDLESGIHSVRVERRGAEPWVEIIEANPGGTYFVRAEFGVERGPRIEHYPPENPATRGPVIVTAAVEGDPAQVTLFFQERGTGEKGILPMTRIAEEGSLFVTAIPRALLEGDGVRYYIRARDAFSQESLSEVFDIGAPEPMRTASRQ
jgi:hypothetical protein